MWSDKSQGLDQDRSDFQPFMQVWKCKITQGCGCVQMTPHRHCTWYGAAVAVAWVPLGIHMLDHACRHDVTDAAAATCLPLLYGVSLCLDAVHPKQLVPCNMVRWKGFPETAT